MFSTIFCAKRSHSIISAYMFPSTHRRLETIGSIPTDDPLILWIWKKIIRFFKCWSPARDALFQIFLFSYSNPIHSLDTVIFFYYTFISWISPHEFRGSIPHFHFQSPNLQAFHLPILHHFPYPRKKSRGTGFVKLIYRTWPKKIHGTRYLNGGPLGHQAEALSTRLRRSPPITSSPNCVPCLIQKN